MIFHLTGSKDTYITNKIVSGVRRATGGNVGYASTVDLFKLYGETSLRGVGGSCDGVDTDEEANCAWTWDSNLTEISRGLIQFDLDVLESEISSFVDADDSSLKIKLVFKDIQGPQVAPANFTLQLWPVSQDWDEGIGDDVSSFSNIQASNWLSCSLGTLWNSEGAELITSWETNDGVLKEEIAEQEFVSGFEDLEVDITEYVKAYWSSDNATVVNNYGWVLKFKTEETDQKSYFVKRFASRHTRNPFLRPKIVASWNDYHIDERLNFYAEKENKISITNYENGEAKNLAARSPTTDPAGQGVRCRLSYPNLDDPTWSAFLREDLGTISQVEIAGVAQTGKYEATITPSLLDTSAGDLKDALRAAGSLLIQEKWDFVDHATGILRPVFSGSFYIHDPQAVTNSIPVDYRFTLLDLKSVYLASDKPTVRLFIRDRNLANESVRIPIELSSQVIPKAYYQIRDTNNQQILIPFSDTLTSADDSTRISMDSQGMYFSFPVSVLPRGRTYTVDIGYYDRGRRRVWESNMAFKVK